MVTMNDIIAFIERAMKENLNIKVDSMDNYYLIYIGDKPKGFSIQNWSDAHGNRFISLEYSLSEINIEISEKDATLFKLEFLKAKEYSKNKVLEAFKNFFKEKDTKPTTINDLDNEDD